MWTGWGQWYCHPFRGLWGHVAHPLAFLRGYGWMQPAGRSGRCCDWFPMECQSKHREARWGPGGAEMMVRQDQCAMALRSFKKEGVRDVTRKALGHRVTFCCVMPWCFQPGHQINELRKMAHNMSEEASALKSNKEAVFKQYLTLYPFVGQLWSLAPTWNIRSRRKYESGNICLASRFRMAHPITKTWTLL